MLHTMKPLIDAPQLKAIRAKAAKQENAGPKK